jgi:glycosyltransferase involved in cell wall biosynthesis
MNSKPDFIPFNAPIYSLREQLWGSYLSWCYQRHFDVFHFPSYNIPWFTPPHTVVTCHDLTHLVFPQFFSSQKLYFARHILKRVANRAKRIITVSEHSRQDLIRFFPQTKEKLTVIYNGVGDDFRALPSEEVDTFKKERELGDFILYVGNRNPHKNLPRLIAAYARLKSAYPDLKLIILNQRVYNDEVCEAISRWKVGEGVIQHQPADSRELVLYYNAARVQVLPSLYEGFGLPVLEAMACGTPVVTSNTSSMPEIAGNAAILIDPCDVDSIVAGVERGLTDSSLRQKLRQAGMDRAREFTWQKAAMKTCQVYQEVIG